MTLDVLLSSVMALGRPSQSHQLDDPCLTSWNGDAGHGSTGRPAPPVVDQLLPVSSRPHLLTGPCARALSELAGRMGSLSP